MNVPCSVPDPEHRTGVGVGVGGGGGGWVGGGGAWVGGAVGDGTVAWTGVGVGEGEGLGLGVLSKTVKGWSSSSEVLPRTLTARMEMEWGPGSGTEMVRTELTTSE